MTVNSKEVKTSFNVCIQNPQNAPERKQRSSNYIIISGRRHGNQCCMMMMSVCMVSHKTTVIKTEQNQFHHLENSRKAHLRDRTQDRDSPGCIWHWPRVWSPSFRTEEVYRRTQRTAGAVQRWRDTSLGDSPNPHKLPGTMTYNLIQT